MSATCHPVYTMIKRLKRWIEDAKYVYEADPAARSVFEVFFLYPGLRALRNHERAKKHYDKKRFTLARWISQRSRDKTLIEIHPGATIGDNVFIDHGAGIVIGETAVVGDRVTIFHGVTLGGTGKEKKVKRHPTVEHDCVLGAGAIILGDITIGHHSKVGANALVHTDVPPYSTAVGMPARIILHDEHGNRTGEIQT